VIEDAVRRYGFLPADDPGIDSLASWLGNAVTLPSLLHMFVFARQHRRLLGDDGFAQARHLVLGSGWRPRSDQHLAAVIAIGLVIGDVGEQAIARLLWAMRCGKVGRIGDAKRHIAKARDGLPHVKSGGERRTAYFFLGAACQVAADLDSAIEAYGAVFDPEDGGRDLITRSALAGCLREAGRGGEALTVLEGIRLDATDPGPELNMQANAVRVRAALHDDNEEYDLAIADYEVVA
jgi:tetratricopeptide (TPR) repeat protein